MGRARQDIVTGKSLLHVTFRCHNREFYFDSNEVKSLVYKILLKYKKKHDLHIFDWVIMSNHVHLLVYAPSRDVLSRYMHSCNLAIAKTINKIFNKRGQAIEDRFRSPVIECQEYALNTVGYIWLNPLRAGMVDRNTIRSYRYSSLYFKLRGLRDRLVSSYEVLERLLGFDVLQGAKIQEFALRFLASLLEREFVDDSILVFEGLHSIGSENFRMRRRWRREFRSSA